MRDSISKLTNSSVKPTMEVDLVLSRMSSVILREGGAEKGERHESGDGTGITLHFKGMPLTLGFGALGRLSEYESMAGKAAAKAVVCGSQVLKEARERE